MIMIPVDSRAIEAIGYEDSTLYVKTRMHGTFAYACVPNTVFEEFLRSPRKAEFLEERVDHTYSRRQTD